MIHTGINNYWIDEYGNVLNKTTGITLKWTFNKQNGYYSVKLSDGPIVHTKYVHRMVGFAYHSESYFEGADINHDDGNKANNYYKNLKWCTRKVNINHAFNNGLNDHKGEKNSQSILTALQAKIIKEALSNGFNRNNIASYFRVHPDTVRSIQSGKNWSHV